MKHLRMAAWSALLFAILTTLLLASAKADACPPPSQPFDLWHDAIMEANPDAKWLELSPADKELFMANFNAMPPITNVATPDTVRFYTKPNAPTGALAFVVGGCVVLAQEVPLETLASLLAVPGEGT